MPSKKNKKCTHPDCQTMIRANNKTCRLHANWQALIPKPDQFKMTRICQKCGKEFRIHQSKQNTCDDCRTYHCAVCGAAFTRSIKEYRKTCSKTCSEKLNGAPILKCQYCGKSFKQKHGHPNKYCGKECVYNALRKLSGQARNGARYKKWRMAVLERDKYMCQRCGARERLQVHHIKPWEKHWDLRFEVNNGVVLCADCHTKEHGRIISPHTKTKMPTCSICGKQTKGRSAFCRSCAMKRSPKLRLASKSRSRGSDGRFGS
jgi:hypothetical protein